MPWTGLFLANSELSLGVVVYRSRPGAGIHIGIIRDEHLPWVTGKLWVIAII